MPPRSIVAMQPVYGDVRSTVRAALAEAEWTRFLAPGAPVALKVNLGWNLFIPGAITSPLVLEALINEIKSHVGRIFVVEADQVLEQVEPALWSSGIGDVCRRTGATWVNMSREPTDVVEYPENTVLKRICVPRVLRNTALVTVPVMKTHAKTVITGALKNQWGCLPTNRYVYHDVLDVALADLNASIRPALAVMDGTVGLEGDGPKSGRPRIADRILCSGDPVALDTVQAVSMGIEPDQVSHLATCAHRGIGTNDLSRIEVRGLDPIRDRVAFKRAGHNPVSRLEIRLRNSPLNRLIFGTPAFRVCLAGARAYYRVWTACYAKKHWDFIKRHPVYGPQWRAHEMGGAAGCVSATDGTPHTTRANQCGFEASSQIREDEPGGDQRSE